MKRNFILSILPLLIFCSCSKNNNNSPSADGTISKFTILNGDSTITASISGNNISFILLPSFDPTSCAPTITLSSITATVSPLTGVTQDFTQPVQYTVTAQNGTKSIYYAKANSTTSTQKLPKAPLSLGIIYCWPSDVNGSSGVVSNAVSILSKFDILVLGDGIWRTTHGDHFNTISVIAGLKSAKPSIKIYGYIDIGVSGSNSQNLSQTQMDSAINGWISMGVTGLYGDEFGSDFGVSRSRQNSFIDECHGKSMSVFVNCSNADDALSDANGITHLQPTDYYLLENGLVSFGSYLPLSDFKTRADKAYYYMRTKGIGVCMVSTLAANSATLTSNNSDQFRLAWCGAAMYDFDAFQFTDAWYSASNSQVYYYPNLSSSYGTTWTQWDWISQPSTTSLSRSTELKTITITDNGSSGSGTITP